MTYTELLSDLEKVKQQISEYEQFIENLAILESDLRKRVGEQMSKRGIKSQETPNNKFRISITSRKDFKVQDEPTVRTFLKTRGLLEECLRLDLIKIKALNKRELIPGMYETESESLTITPIKDKIAVSESVVQEESMRDFRERVRADRENNFA